MEIKASPGFFKSLKRLNSPLEKISEAWSWISYHFSRDFWKLLKIVLKGYPWDYSYLYALEKAKIEEMCKYHERYRCFEGCEYVIRDMKICIALIEIFNEKETDLFHYTGEPIKGTDNVEVDSSGLEYHCDVYVNTRNASRFLSEEQQKHWHPHAIYIEKARRLYHKIRVERDQEWWD